MKKVLVVGSGAREHAICKKLLQSKEDLKIYVAPGNAGTSIDCTNVNIAAEDIQGLLAFAQEEEIDLTMVGPEGPLVAGIVDEFQGQGLRIFGPDKASAQLEGSKVFSKTFLEKYGLPTARYEEYSDYHQAVDAINDWSYPLVIKADGLCAGKGVVICKTPVEALYTLKDILVEEMFGSEGSSIIIEEFLEGYEASVFCLGVDGKLSFLGTAKDYKKIGDGDQGLNTGGMGCYSPNTLIEDFTMTQIQEEIIPKIEKAMAEEGLNFNGILFIGFMVTENGPQILEFNTRFGDPETQVLLPRLENDLFQVLWDSTEGVQPEIQLSDKTAMTVIMASGGYPESFKKGFEITGLEELEGSGLDIVQGGTAWEGDKLVTAGGRVLSVVALADDLPTCRDKIYEKIDRIHFKNSYYRQDIGK